MPNTIVTNLTQGTTPATHQVRDVSTLLSKYEPDLYPLDTLLRQTQLRKQAEQVKIEWASYSTMNRKANVTALSTAAANATTAATIAVDSSAAFVPDDILVVVKTVNSAKIIDTTMPQLIVTSVPSSTSVSVKAFDPSAAVDNAYVLTPAIPSGSILTFIGNAKKEGFAKGQAKMIIPGYEYNYCQIFETLVKVSRTRKATKNYTKQHDWDTARKEQLGEFRRSLEYTEWFGKRAVTNDATNDNGDLRWKMGGVTSFIPNTIDYAPASLAETNLMDWMKVVFSGNNGSPTRILFMDSELSTSIQKTQLSKGRSLETVKVAGLTCSKIVFNEGTLLLKHTRAFNEAGLAHYGVVLDMKQLGKKELRPMERLKLDLYKQGTEDAEAEQYIEQSSIELLNPNCHAIVRGVL